MAKNEPKGDCRLFKIPAELRNRIYQLVLIEDKPIYMRKPNLRDGATLLCTYRLVTGASEPGLLQMCQDVRKETLPIF